MTLFLNSRLVVVGIIVSIGLLVFNAYSESQKVLREKHEAAEVPVPKHRNFIVVGGGVAGIQWGLFLEGMKQSGTSYAILERNEKVGEFWDMFPRGRHLISINKRFVGMDKSADFALRHDWNSLLGAKYRMSEFSDELYPNAADLGRYMRNISAEQISEIFFNREIVRTSYNGSVHTVVTQSGEEWTCDHLIIATGYEPKQIPQCLASMGEDESLSVYNYDTFPDVRTGTEDWCRNKRILVLGSGNSAFETTNIVSNCAASVFLATLNTPKFSSITHYVGNVRMRNADILDRYQLKSLDAVLEIFETEEDRENDNMCDSIAAMTGIHHPDGFDEHLAIDVIIFAGGFTTEKEGLVRVDPNNLSSPAARKFPAVDAFWRDPTEPKQWYAGCLMHSLDYGNSAGGFIHGFRYLIRSQFNYIREKFFSQPWPATSYHPILTLEQKETMFKDGGGESEALTYEEKKDLFFSIQEKDQRVHLIEKVIERVQNSSGIYQMQDVLFDVVDFGHFRENGVVYREEVPRAWIGDVVPSGCRACILIGLQYSDKKVWNFDLMFNSTRFLRKPGLFLHPVFIAMVNGEAVAEVHIEEDVDFAFVQNRFIVEMNEKLHTMIDLFVEGATESKFKQKLRE